MDEIKVIPYWVPACETGRHFPPHPDMTCDEADEWIRVRDRILGEYLAAAWHEFARQSDPLTGTAFAPPASPAAELPERDAVHRALATLRPHLAWDHRYRA